MWLLLKYTLLYAAVLMLVALGGMFSERSGVINIALEGIMVIGGLLGVVMINLMNAAGVPIFLGILISIAISAIAGMVYSSMLAFSAINLKADQTIGGTALNQQHAANGFSGRTEAVRNHCQQAEKITKNQIHMYKSPFVM